MPLFSRLGFKPDTPEAQVEADLKRVTESGIIEIPEDLLSAVVPHTQTEEDRRVVMRHLRECLAEPSGRRWRRVYAALALVDYLARHASPELVAETASGRHFDLIQRLSLLEAFECTTDKRVQNCVRTRAKALRAELVPRLQTALEGAATCESIGDTASTCSPGIASVASSSAALTALGGGGPDSPNGVAPFEKPSGQMILNGIVAVGHNDDTTSDSDNDDGPRKAVQYRERHGAQHKVGTKATRSKAATQDDSDSDESKTQQKQGGSDAPPPPRPVQTVDLLEL